MSGNKDKPLKPNQCRPLVHHSVKDRFVKDRFDLVPEYRPPALRGLEFDLLLPYGTRKSLSGISGSGNTRTIGSRTKSS